MMEQVASERERLFPNMTFVWQTLPAVGCGPAPLSSPPGTTFWAHHPPPLWNWMELKHRDSFSRNFWKARGAVVLDLHPMLLRVDSHPSVWLHGNQSNAKFTTNRTYSHRRTENVTNGFEFGPTSTANDCIHQCTNGPLQTVYLDFLQHLFISRSV